MLFAVCVLIWLSQTVTQTATSDCGDQALHAGIDVVDINEWPALQGFSSDLVNRVKSVAVGLTTVNGQRAPQTILHTKDKRTYLRGNSTFYHLYPCQGNTETREIVEIRGLAVKDVRVGWDFMAILTEEGSLYTAGVNNYGQLGHHGTQYRKIFSKVEGLPRVKQIAFGDGNHCVVLTHNGQLWSWGYGYAYRLGYSTSSYTNPVPKSISIKQGLIAPVHVCCGYYACSVLMDNYTVINWGQGGYTGRPGGDLLPGLVHGIPSDQKITKIACGAFHTLALSLTGRLFGWGYNRDGELLGAVSTASTVTELSLGGKIVRDVVAGRRITVIKTYSKKPEYFGWYNSRATWTSTTTCDLENVRDVLAKSYDGQATWGLVRLDCDLEDDETGQQMVAIYKNNGTMKISEGGGIAMEATQFRKLVKLGGL